MARAPLEPKNARAGNGAIKAGDQREKTADDIMSWFLSAPESDPGMAEDRRQYGTAAL